jgi:hypothetical protein
MTRAAWLWLAGAFLSPFHRVRAIPSGRAAACVIYFAAQLGRGAL